MSDMSDDVSATAADPLLTDLTPPQVEAVTHVDGALLVLAGPGSGKTRVITRRVAHLVRRTGIAPWNVLAITFTNKAAAEMRERVAQLVTEGQARAITVATFHSLCARLIRQFADRLGLPPGYSIYDSSDQQRAMKQALAELEMDSSNFPPSRMLSTISNAKNDLLDAAGFAANAADFYSRTVAKVYTRYEAILARNHALDFDDLLLKTVQLLQQHRDVLEQLQYRYQYILIDEYQDTNHAQFMIASALAAGHGNLCATGDPDQSIYGWRGANIRNILEFEQHYPDAKVVRLEQNYRSTKAILAAADALIQNNAARKAKSLWTENPQGEPIKVATCRDERHEASWVVEQFRHQHDAEGLAWSDMAVFYRMNSLSRVMEDALRDAGVPYQIARGTAFYDRKEIKDAVAYLRVIANPADEVNLYRIINTPTRGLSDRTVKAMQAHSLAHNISAVDLLANPTALTALNSRAQNSATKFGKLLEGWRTAAGLSDNATDSTPVLSDFRGAKGRASSESISLRELVQRILRESGLEDYYAKDKSDPDNERLANLGEFVTFAQQFDEQYIYETQAAGDGSTPPLAQRLLGLLEQISLISDVDSVDPEQGAVTLMTLHAAKGLEFPAVAIIGVEDGLLPHQRAQDSEHEQEEERRLCFVGITRAMRTLTLSHARYRTIFGQTMPTIPSRFLNELPREILDEVDLSEQDNDWLEVGHEQRAAASREAAAFPPGSLVRHAQFGLGRIITIQPSGAHTRARVQFNTAGIKTLILQYANLEKVEDWEL